MCLSPNLVTLEAGLAAADFTDLFPFDPKKLHKKPPAALASELKQAFKEAEELIIMMDI